MSVAVTVGLLVFGAVYLLSKREMLRIILGMVLLGHAANLLLLAAGGTYRRGLPFTGMGEVEGQADPLPQAFVLTAIVIAFAITIFMLVLAVTGRSDDRVAEDADEFDPLEEAASDARFPRDERERAARVMTGALPVATPATHEGGERG
ncbi:MAG: cation:proton antiporter subunit C [Micrococcaceae bacterium]|nr:cation:proton antiporter subunit C [Micrococcaceae bacterium]